MAGDDRVSLWEKDLSRREMLKLFGSAAAAGMLGMYLPGRVRAQAASRPNIIFILCDDHRWDHLSCMGHAFLETPNLDRLAQDGVLCENAFVTTSLCSPSRGSFLTGQYAHAHGVLNNITPWNDSNVTFLELLKGSGYDTAFIGKWHMPGKGLPNLRGVDRFISFTEQRGQGRYYNCPLFIDGVWTKPRKEYITEELTDHAMDFIRQERVNPFCVYLSHKAVHHRWLPPRDLKGKYRDIKNLGLPPEADNWVGLVNNHITYGTLGRLEDMYRGYCETLVSVDREVGRLMNFLDEAGLADNTMVIYAGDNGYFWGEHHLVDKRWAYEESIRVPFIVRSPRHVAEPGRRISEMVLNIDLAPTLLEIAGIPSPGVMEGESLVSLLGSSQPRWRRSWLYEYFRDYPYTVPGIFAVRTDTYKYIEMDSPCYPPELYNLMNDPKEKNNLMGSDEGDRVLPGLKRDLTRLKRKSGFQCCVSKSQATS